MDGEGRVLTIPANVVALLRTIPRVEGTAEAGPVDMYRVLYGWRPGRVDRLFSDMSAHPQRRFWIRSGEPVMEFDTFTSTETTTAAGAFQITWPTFRDFLQWRVGQRLARPAFDKAGQEACAIWLMQRARAYNDIAAGRFAAGIYKLSGTWASLPYSTAGQRTWTLAATEVIYRQAGGEVVA